MQLGDLNLSKSVEVTEKIQELYVFAARGGGGDSGAVDEGQILLVKSISKYMFQKRHNKNPINYYSLWNKRVIGETKRCLASSEIL